MQSINVLDDLFRQCKGVKVRIEFFGIRALGNRSRASLNSPLNQNAGRDLAQIFSNFFGIGTFSQSSFSMIVSSQWCENYKTISCFLVHSSSSFRGNCGWASTWSTAGLILANPSNFSKLANGEVGDTNVIDETSFNEALQCSPGFFNRDLRVG